MEIRPLADRLLVEIIEKEDTLAGGLLLPETAKTKSQQGCVLAIGKGRHENGERIPIDVKVDDRILFAKYAGIEIKLDGKELFILKEGEILGIVQS